LGGGREAGGGLATGVGKGLEKVGTIQGEEVYPARKRMTHGGANGERSHGG